MTYAKALEALREKVLAVIANENRCNWKQVHPNSDCPICEPGCDKIMQEIENQMTDPTKKKAWLWICGCGREYIRHAWFLKHESHCNEEFYPKEVYYWKQSEAN